MTTKHYIDMLGYINKRLTKIDHDRAWDAIGNRCPIPNDVRNKIDDAINDFCVDYDLDFDAVISEYDIEDIYTDIEQ